ncbi:MAG TPA: sulfite exporter TauE/SafE family protein [Casimicrobiaceae bacterium]|nr:sulfite exporter TauE/SafE family protein [Casimicrobiaceae bacterium]
MHWQLLPFFLVIGSLAGFLAGLLGVGGAMTMIPVLTIIFTSEGFPPEHVVHMAVATSLATIMFTSLSSMRAHARRGAVLWHVMWGLAPGIVAGSLVGPQIVAVMSSALVAALFAAFTGFAGVQMLQNREPKASRTLPGKPGLFGVGATIGVVSSMVGAGGAFLSVPFMIWCNVRVRSAVGTSAAIGFPISAAGTVGYVVAGLRQESMPLTVGYVNLPALAGIVVASIVTAPLGAKLAHRWPVAKLRRAFAFLLFAIGGYMIWKSATFAGLVR